MPYYRMQGLECKCGQIIYLVQAEAPESLRVLLQNVGAAVFVCGTDTANCPKCGLSYDLPADEALDADRTPFGRFIERLERNDLDDAEPPG